MSQIKEIEASPLDDWLAGLTEKQASFVLHYTSSEGAIGNAAEAARLAGYTGTRQAEIAYQLLRLPHIRNAIAETNRKAIAGKLSTLATWRLGQILATDGHKARDYIDAAKTVLDRGGFIHDPGKSSSDQVKSPAEMSRAELGAFVAAARRQLAVSEAVDVDSAANSAAIVGDPAQAPQETAKEQPVSNRQDTDKAPS